MPWLDDSVAAVEMSGIPATWGSGRTGSGCVPLGPVASTAFFVEGELLACESFGGVSGTADKSSVCWIFLLATPR